MKSFLDQCLTIIIWSGLGLGIFIASIMLGFAVFHVLTVILGVPAIVIILLLGFITFTFLGSVYLRWFTE